MTDKEIVWIPNYLREHGFSMGEYTADIFNWTTAINAAKQLGVVLADYDTIENAEKVLQLAKRLKELVAFL